MTSEYECVCDDGHEKLVVQHLCNPTTTPFHVHERKKSCIHDETNDDFVCLPGTGLCMSCTWST